VIALDDVMVRPGIAKAQVQAATDGAKKKTG
jgi:hypothetical protein